MLCLKKTQKTQLSYLGDLGLLSQSRWSLQERMGFTCSSKKANLKISSCLEKESPPFQSLGLFWGNAGVSQLHFEGQQKKSN